MGTPAANDCSSALSNPMKQEFAMSKTEEIHINLN